LCAAPYALGASCIGGLDPEAERKECEEVCAAEAQCEFRSETDCLAALCAEDGFRSFDDADGTVDLQNLDANACMKDAEDCGALAACSCGDSCARVDECTGSEDATCEDNCNVLLEQAPDATYTENRCKMESTCEDLPTCGGVSG
jgi:hypothetical protein